MDESIRGEDDEPGKHRLGEQISAARPGRSQRWHYTLLRCALPRDEARRMVVEYLSDSSILISGVVEDLK